MSNYYFNTPAGGPTTPMVNGTPMLSASQIRQPFSSGSNRPSIGSTYHATDSMYQTLHESGQRILSERVVEHEVKVPKKVIREDIVEKVVIIPEKIVHEEFMEESAMIREKIIEVATPVIQERIVEVPEIEYVEKIVEVPEIIIQERIKEVPRIEIQERIIEVPRIVTQEKLVEITEVEYREYPVEKIVEVPEIIEHVVIKEIPVPQYVDKPVPEYVDVQVEQEVRRVIPVPLEAITTCHFTLPRLRPQYTNVDVPFYIPRFIEVPVPVDAMDGQTVMQAEHYAQQVALLATSNKLSLCEVESLAGTIKQADFASVLAKKDHSTLLTQHWQSGRLQINPSSLYYSVSTSDAQVVVDTEVAVSTTVAVKTTNSAVQPVESSGTSSEVNVKTGNKSDETVNLIHDDLDFGNIQLEDSQKEIDALENDFKKENEIDDYEYDDEANLSD